MKKKIILLLLLTSLILQACSNASTTENAVPHLTGTILELDHDYGRILMEATGSTFSAKAKVWLTITSESELIGMENRHIKFEDFKIGMEAEVELVNGVVLDSEPQVGTIEKIKILK